MEIVCDRVLVMYLGIAENGVRDDILRAPLHPYTQSLLSAAPIPGPALQRSRQRVVLTGELPNPRAPARRQRRRARPASRDAAAWQLQVVVRAALTPCVRWCQGQPEFLPEPARQPAPASPRISRWYSGRR